MKRSFYTSPEAAGWMQRQFWMEMTDVHGNRMEWSKHKHSWAWRAVGVIGTPTFTGDKIYIHPDSLHLLEPRVGDLVTYAVGEVMRLHPTKRTYQVIQRNGIPFHWPELEEV